MLPVLVYPYNTLALASDENYEVQVISRISGSIDVEVDGNVVKTVSFTEGASILQIGTPNDFIIANDSGKNIKLIVKDSGGNVIDVYTIPVYFIDGTNGIIEFHDENDAQLVGDIGLVYISDDVSYIRQYRGYVMSIPASSSLPYNKMYVEYISYSDGKKYYFIQRLDKFSLGETNIVVLKPRKYFDLHILLQIDDTRLPDYMNWMIAGMGWITQVANVITPATLISKYYDPLVRAFFNNIGIHVPIIKVEKKDDTIEVVFRIDPNPTLVVVAIIIALIVAGIIAIKIIDAWTEVEYYHYLNETNKIIQQYNDMRQEMINKCNEIATNVQEYIQCVKEVDKFINNASSHDRKLLKDAEEDSERKEDEIEKLKKLIMIFGVTAGGLILLKMGVK